MNGIILEKAILKVKKKKKVRIRFACIGTVDITSKVDLTMFILMKTVIFNWACIFRPVYLDPSIWTHIFRPLYLDPSIWTHLFQSVFLIYYL